MNKCLPIFLFSSAWSVLRITRFFTKHLSTNLPVTSWWMFYAFWERPHRSSYRRGSLRITENVKNNFLGQGVLVAKTWTLGKYVWVSSQVAWYSLFICFWLQWWTWQLRSPFSLFFSITKWSLLKGLTKNQTEREELLKISSSLGHLRFLKHTVYLDCEDPSESSQSR